MDQRAAKGVASRFAEYIEHLSAVIGHADRHGPLASYCTGLLLPGARKSVEPMAARIAPDDVGAKHQSLHHFVAKAPWDEADLIAAVRTFVLPKIEERAPIRGWIIDDTGIPKKGKHSVAVARQYCGELGKQDNCQVAVTLSVASDTPGCRLHCGFIFPRCGPMMPRAARRPACRRTSSFRPSRTSHSIRSGKRSKMAYRRALCWRTPVTATTPHSAAASPN